MVDHDHAEQIIGKKYEEMCPFVQDLLIRTATDGDLNEKCLKMMRDVHSGVKGTHLIIKDRGLKTKKLSLKNWFLKPKMLLNTSCIWHAASNLYAIIMGNP